MCGVVNHYMFFSLGPTISELELSVLMWEAVFEEAGIARDDPIAERLVTAVTLQVCFSDVPLTLFVSVF